MKRKSKKNKESSATFPLTLKAAGGFRRSAFRARERSVTCSGDPEGLHYSRSKVNETIYRRQRPSTQ